MDNFEKRFGQMQTLAVGLTIVYIVAGVALCGFGIWVTMTVMSYFGII